jgi:colanic acid/amylovoran biosynthesis protein
MSPVKHHTPPRKSGSESSFLLVGNASYQNRGCEAIVRGTVNILGNGAPDPEALRFTSAFYGTPDALAAQRKSETDKRIDHLRVEAAPARFTRAWWETRLNERFGTDFPGVSKPLLPSLESSCCALEVGGDNYTLDYGFPEHLIRMDRWLSSQGVPVVIWGASIGPFTESPVYESRMMEHLRSLEGVFVRESVTYDYLTKEHRLKNVSLFADSAFLMEQREPVDEAVRAKVKDAPLAFNMSPLLSAYTTTTRKMPWETKAEDLVPRIRECAEIVAALRNETGLPILLLPHVQSPLAGIDDYEFLRGVHRACKDAGIPDVEIADEPLGARELKWLIARCRMVIAARTHATIAGFSTGVPTISLGYSRKAVGINRDVFGTEDYLVMARDIAPGNLAERARYVLSRESELMQSMPKRAEELKRSAALAGDKLRQILAARSSRS